MPTIQVRNIPNDLYVQIQYLAEQEQRSIAEQTIFLLKESLNNSNSNKNRRRMIVKKMEALAIPDVQLPDPVTLLREDRER
ncbi:MAG: hypothetical protein P1P65_02795 [Treponema sp.]